MASIPLAGAEIYCDPNFLACEEATNLFEVLRTKCTWQRHRTSFNHAVPRDEAYYGDPGTTYTYSRREYKPLPWIPELLALKTRVEEATPAVAYSNLSLPRLGYNAVLCNLYLNGNDSVSLHTDAEPEMGPVIASVSLGAERLFRFRGNKIGWDEEDRNMEGSFG
jgi:alkylated DNA repair dioxygenase AlkB